MTEMESMIALAGNPNCGKTTLFNEITGARQHVGNYPGVTVEKKEGTWTGDGFTLHVVDLPGSYSLTAYSLEEVVARDFLVNERPAVIINIVDASNLERHLYLTVQLMEMGLPVCIALNMVDLTRKLGISIDVSGLSRLMGVPVVPTVARKGEGKQQLLDTVSRILREQKRQVPLDISYGHDIDQALDEMEDCIEAESFLTGMYRARWTALKYLEDDPQIKTLGRQKNPALAVRLEALADRVGAELHGTLDTSAEAVIADHRYGYIKSILRQGVLSREGRQDRLHLSDRLDAVLTHRFAGPLIMMAVLLGLYSFTFSLSAAPVAWLEGLFGWAAGTADAELPDGLVKSLIISGIIDGVGGVLGFVPLIMLMFLGITFLEDTGYLARVAFMLDRVFRAFGLHGSSVMAFIVSGGIAGGCAVPGVMASRTLKSSRERLATLLTVPFMNCGAKLPVFALLIATFFAQHETVVMFLVTMISWAGALLVAKLLRITVIRGESTPFVMELPPYRFPTFKGLLLHTWERTWQYIKKAGTVILGISVILWAMMTFPGLPGQQRRVFELERTKLLAAAHPAALNELESSVGDVAASREDRTLTEKIRAVDAAEAEAGLRNSLAGRLGIALEGVSQRAGFDWRTNIALIGGFAAKEVVVSTLGTAYSLGAVDPDESGPLSATLAASPYWTPLVALSLIVFTIFYAPCFVTVVCIAREAGSWMWGAFSVLFNTALAFTLAALVYQVGSAVGF